MSLEAVTAYLESPEGKAAMDKYFDKLVKRKTIAGLRMFKINELSDADFEKLMKYVIKNNGEEWTKKCYSRGCQPYPTNILSLLFETASFFGKPDEEDSEIDFPSDTYHYRGYSFFSMYGQGVHQRVYHGDEAVIWL